MLLDEYVENRRALELLKERDRASFLLAPSQLTQMAAAGKLDPRRVQVLSEIWNRTQDQNKLLTAFNTRVTRGALSKITTLKPRSAATTNYRRP